MKANDMLNALIFGGDGSSTINDMSTSGGESDSGKVLAVNSNGKITPVNLTVGEGTVAVDSTLAVTGAAADAKKTGDEIATLNESLDDMSRLTDSYVDLVTQRYTLIESASGAVIDSAGNISSVESTTRNVRYVAVNNDYTHVVINARKTSSNETKYAFYSSETYSGCSSETAVLVGDYTNNVNTAVEIPDNAKILCICCNYINTNGFSFKREETKIKSDMIAGVNKVNRAWWEIGSINTSTGASSGLVNRIRTKRFVPKYVFSMEVVNGWKYLAYAWSNNGTFVGTYNQRFDTFSNSATFLTGTFFVEDFYDAYPTYNLKFVITNEADQTDVSGADNAPMMILTEKYIDIELSHRINEEQSPTDAGKILAVGSDGTLSLTDPTEIFDIYSDSDAGSNVSVFVSKMNEYAENLGMTNTSFLDPSGLNASSEISARDMVRMGIAACGYPEIARIWGVNSKSIRTHDESHTTHVFDNHTSGWSSYESTYHLFGSKGGTLQNSCTLVMACQVGEKIVVGAIGDADGKNARMPAMYELIQICDTILSGGTNAQTVTNATKACAAVLPVNPPMYNGYDFDWIYEQNADDIVAPASTAKLVTCMVALDWITNRHEKIKITTADNLTAGSGTVFSDGEILDFEQALQAILLISSCPMSRCIGRIVGGKIRALDA